MNDELVKKQLEYLVSRSFDLMSWEDMDLFLDAREVKKAKKLLYEKSECLIFDFEKVVTYLKSTKDNELKTIISFLEEMTGESYVWLIDDIKKLKADSK